MNPTTYGLVFAGGLLLAMLMLHEIGRRVGIRRLALDPEGAREGHVVVDTAVFGLLGLLMAFTFSGAATRFEGRRHLIVEEANDIGTAYLRIDVLPAAAQPALREPFRQYLDSRLEFTTNTISRRRGGDGALLPASQSGPPRSRHAATRDRRPRTCCC
jgi:hypothetical protein